MAAPTYDALKLPAHVNTVLITGAGGFVGQKLTALLLDLYPALRIITTDLHAPPRLDDARQVCVGADLGKPAEVARLFEGETVGGVFALHGIMSGGSEANFALGYAVNVDSHVNLLRAAHAHADAHFTQGPKVVYVYVSGLAVYGGPKCRPQDTVLPTETPLLPGTSYGVEKAITELYVFDYGRKGYLDTRSLRLPTVAIRSGAPSSAASSFISGLIREPLQGLPSECPIADGWDDAALDDLPFYLSRARTVFRNLVWGMCLPERELVKQGHRSVNVPGITLNTRTLLNALLEHAPDAKSLVTFRRDPAVLAIMQTWPGAFDNTDALALGFEQDDPATGFASAVGDFKAELAAAK
ncbi:hypothetical protein Q5752_003268 [Cryptotrichosporon argae]